MDAVMSKTIKLRKGGEVTVTYDADNAIWTLADPSGKPLGWARAVSHDVEAARDFAARAARAFGLNENRLQRWTGGANRTGASLLAAHVP